jgi:hypothetical protein
MDQRGIARILSQYVFSVLSVLSGLLSSLSSLRSSQVFSGLLSSHSMSHSSHSMSCCVAQGSAQCSHSEFTRICCLYTHTPISRHCTYHTHSLQQGICLYAHYAFATARYLPVCTLCIRYSKVFAYVCAICQQCVLACAAIISPAVICLNV